MAKFRVLNPPVWVVGEDVKIRCTEEIVETNDRKLIKLLKAAGFEEIKEEEKAEEKPAAEAEE